jgi:superfamily II DNA helicase RecQ
VALSRCKTLEGMVLASLLNRTAVICDATIKKFGNEIENKTPDERLLRNLQRNYFLDMLSEQFAFYLLEQQLLLIVRILDEHLYRLYPLLLERYKETSNMFKTRICKVADSFKIQYSQMAMDVENYTNNPVLDKRIIAGAHYFQEELETLFATLLDETRVETDNKEVKKKFTEAFVLLKETVYIKQGTLALTEKDGFSVSAYLKNKAYLMLSANDKPEKKEHRSRSARPERTETPANDVLHPVLYSKLIEWRYKEAKQLSIPVYMVIQQKAILGIVNSLPRDSSELLHIPYIGKQTVEKYGERILDMIEQYVENIS